MKQRISQLVVGLSAGNVNAFSVSSAQKYVATVIQSHSISLLPERKAGVISQRRLSMYVSVCLSVCTKSDELLIRN